MPKIKVCVDICVGEEVKYKGKKISRNELCPCGSAIKFKLCHGKVQLTYRSNTLQKQPLNEYQAKKILQEQQQGLGRPIISTLCNGNRIIAVANKVYWSMRWKTFHDFLNDYIKNVLSSDWGNNELKKSLEDRHPILQWYDMLCNHQKTSIKIPGEIHSLESIGTIHAYMHLSYNLYLLAHNQPADEYSDKLQKEIIKRLKHKDHFPGAYYETYVYAIRLPLFFS